MLFTGIKSAGTILGSHEWQLDKLENFTITFWEKPTFTYLDIILMTLVVVKAYCFEGSLFLNIRNSRSAINLIHLWTFRLWLFQIVFVNYCVEDGKKILKILSTFWGLQKIKVDWGARKNAKVVLMLWPTNKKCTIGFCV